MSKSAEFAHIAHHITMPAHKRDTSAASKISSEREKSGAHTTNTTATTSIASAISLSAILLLISHPFALIDSTVDECSKRMWRFSAWSRPA